MFLQQSLIDPLVNIISGLNEQFPGKTMEKTKQIKEDLKKLCIMHEFVIGFNRYL
jgi:hypothetical protein